MYFFEKKSMEEIAYKLEFENTQVAKNKKLRCLGYLKNLIKGHPLYKKIMNDE